MTDYCAELNTGKQRRQAPFARLAISAKEIMRNINFAIDDICSSGRYVLGKYVEQLERRMAELCGCRFAVGVNSGTDALVLVLKALGIAEGDEVIVPPNCFAAVANAVCIVGARPVFCDVRYQDMLMDAERLPELITPRTRAVIPVHLTGMPCDMDDIIHVARSHGIHVIEDAAQALGAVYRGSQAGSLGIAGCFSFHPLKNIHALGDGGAVVTNDPALQAKLFEFRNHGLRDGEVVQPGLNSRLDEIHAAAIAAQLDFLSEIIEFKRRAAAFYTESLRAVVAVNDEPDWKKGVYQLYMIKSPRRDDLATFLAEHGVGTAVHYRKYVCFHPWYVQRFGRPSHLPVTERLSDEVLSLPIWYGMSDDDLNYVAEAVRTFFSHSS